MRLKFAVVAMSALLASPPRALAQGCALCYTSSSALGQHAERSLDFGILALLAPALILFASVIFLLYRRAVAGA